MHHIVVLKDAYHMDKAVHLGKLVEQSARNPALARATIQAGDIYIGDLGVDRFLGVEHLAQFIHTWIGHIHHGGVHLYLATGHTGGLATAGERVEKCCFASLRKTNNSQFHAVKNP
ncbi:hypothetical protein SDC9_193397 [bioreactor metagenome]|uniref:Uncharacterized protein n=1 Tax=bioreactor metagenome TaxID=1076179 RepID=A0A645I3F6_9ZZZZ